jgi:serine phosphatase RsbU (regulator of sigma subunit)
MLEPRSELAQAPLLGDAASHGITIWTAPADGSRAGGDWCEVVEISEDVTALTIGDVAGHGDDAAEVMRAARGSVLHALRFMRDPSDVLAAANAFIANRTDEPIVTAIVAYYNRARRTLSYANAGHPPPLLIGRNSASYLRAIRADIPLGVYARHCAQVYTISVPAQTLVVLYTDGVTERERDPIRGERELADAGILAYDLSDGDYARTIAESVFASGRGHDDAGLMVLDTAGPSARRARTSAGSSRPGIRSIATIERHQETQP